MNNLQQFFKDKVFGDLTQCTMCGEENAWKFGKYFRDWPIDFRVSLYCANCFHEVQFDVRRAGMSLGLDIDEIDAQFSVLCDEGV